MTIVVEDGTIVANADSYLSVADADTYFTGHGNPSEWSGLTTAEKEASLKYATKKLDQLFKWYGNIEDTTQVLGWPRTAFYDSEGRTIGGTGIMPQALLDATAEMALEYSQDDFVASSTNVARERIGSSEVQYAGNASTKSYTYVTALVSELGVRKSSRRRVIKG